MKTSKLAYMGPRSDSREDVDDWKWREKRKQEAIWKAFGR